MTIPKEIEGYDWEQVFGAAGEEPDSEYGSIYNPGSPYLAVPPEHPDKNVRQPKFARKDVAKIVAVAEGENDGADWICVGRLRDGRWFVVSGGCDYTGWDCQSSASARVARRKSDLIRWGLSDAERERLGLRLPPERKP